MGLIDRLSRVNSARKPLGQPPPPMAPSGKRAAFIESIRWKGEIYCRNCGSVLKRVPVAQDWYKEPRYNPMTGAELSEVERYGNEGLMVCADFEERRLSMMLSFRASFQTNFADMHIPDHGMYYTDKPPL